MKFHNKKTFIGGIKFDSKREAARYLQLLELQQHGLIKDLRLQPSFMLQPAFKDNEGVKVREVRYIADFQYIGHDGITHVEDVKGMRTKEYIIKSKWFRFLNKDHTNWCFREVK